MQLMFSYLFSYNVEETIWASVLGSISLSSRILYMLDLKRKRSDLYHMSIIINTIFFLESFFVFVFKDNLQRQNIGS